MQTEKQGNKALSNKAVAVIGAGITSCATAKALAQEETPVVIAPSAQKTGKTGNISEVISHLFEKNQYTNEILSGREKRRLRRKKNRKK